MGRKEIAERRAKVRALWESGEREVIEIAKALGVRYNVAWGDLRDMGLTAPERRPRSVAKRRRAKVAALIKSGKSAREIAEALGVSATMVYRDRHALGLKFADTRNRTPARKQAMVRAAKILLGSGMTKEEIALALGVSAATVRTYFHETLHKPVEPEPPDFLREAREKSSLDFCLCLNQDCPDYIAHEQRVLEWNWARVERHARRRISATDSIPVSIPFGSVA